MLSYATHEHILKNSNYKMSNKLKHSSSKNGVSSGYPKSIWVTLKLVSKPLPTCKCQITWLFFNIRILQKSDTGRTF